jgi:hypothetical protein
MGCYSGFKCHSLFFIDFYGKAESKGLIPFPAKGLVIPAKVTQYSAMIRLATAERLFHF